MKGERFRDAVAASLGRRLVGFVVLVSIFVLVGAAARVALS